MLGNMWRQKYRLVQVIARMCQRECELLRRMALERGKREKGRKPTRGGGVYWRDWRDRYLLFVLTNNGRACARHQPHVGQRIDRVAASGRGSPEEPQVGRSARQDDRSSMAHPSVSELAVSLAIGVGEVRRDTPELELGALGQGPLWSGFVMLWLWL